MLQDIFGNDAVVGAGGPLDDNQRECVVCYSTIKDTVVYPCRHICLCSPCTQVVRMQSSRCPICRAPATKFIHIKVEGLNEPEVLSINRD